MNFVETIPFQIYVHISWPELQDKPESLDISLMIQLWA